MHEFPKREGESFTIFCREQMPESKFVVERARWGRERDLNARRRLRVGLVVGCQKNGESFDKRVKGPFCLCGKCRDELREMQVKVLQLPTNNCLISFIGSLSPTAKVHR